MGSLWEGIVSLVVRKTITLLIVLLLVLTVEFLFFRVGMGYEAYLPKGSTPETIELVRERLHLDENVVVQYFYYISDMLTGKGSFDLYSFSGHRTVAEVIDHSLPRTLILFGSALAFSLLIGFLAAYALWKMKSQFGKTVSSAVFLILWAVPVVMVALFFLVQVVWRFEIDWAVAIPPVDYASMGWGDRVIYDLQIRTFPIIILTICSFGGFALTTWQGIRRVNETSSGSLDEVSPNGPPFSECVVSVMPNLKLNLAFVMSCALFVEIFWNVDGLGARFNDGLFSLDIPLVEVSVFAILLVVLLSGFFLDLSFSLFANRSSWAAPRVTRTVSKEERSDPSSHEATPLSSSVFIEELRWFGARYMRSPPGIVGGIMLAAIALLALVGPLIVGPYSLEFDLPSREPDPVSEFLIGARGSFLQTLVVLSLSMGIGFLVALFALPLGRFSYPIVVIAETFLIFPIVGMILLVMLVRPIIEHPIWFVVLSTTLVTWAPVTLVVLRRARPISDAYRSRLPNEAGITRYKAVLLVGMKKTLPDAVAALKYVAVIGSLSILIFEYNNFWTNSQATWGGMITHSVEYMKFLDFDLWWMLPLIGMVVMVSGFYLVLHATQVIIEERFRPHRPAVSLAPSGA